MNSIFFEKEGFTLINGDSFKVLKELSEKMHFYILYMKVIFYFI